MKYTLPPLPYAYTVLEPYIDAKTVELHYTKHHQLYVDKLNAVLEKYPKLSDKKPEELLANLSSLEMNETDRTTLKNHGGGYLNHNLYWQIMGAKKTPDQQLIAKIVTQFGSVDECKQLITNAALARFGSGWAWLVENAHGVLEVYSTANQDSPYLSNHTPIIALDVWEHAYYLKYQNRRAEYIENWWNVFRLF